MASLKSSFSLLIFILSTLVFILAQLHTYNPPPELLNSLDIATKLTSNSTTIALASKDFGGVTEASPAGVFLPSSISDIVKLVRFSYESPVSFTIAARGCGHSTRGQALAPGGVVVDMRSISKTSNGEKIRVFKNEMYVDAGGEQLWIDVLHETLKHGLAPRSWTDYLYLTVGGTLSNAGVSGQTFLHGPQISNVHELDVVTGKGEMITCSEKQNSDLFFAVLGGLGQFGIITRARIAVEPAPERVRWVRLIYTNFSDFTRDQEWLITMDQKKKKGFQYIEGSLLMDQRIGSSWRSSFSQELELLLQELSFLPGFSFTNDVSYLDFLDRVHHGELKLRSKGLWDVPHPWLNIFVPKSRIQDFNLGVFTGILKNNSSMGPILIYPINKNK
ncbi:hypothetical protein J5N97_006374 [Dioscorea zingiberensis]|uniref:cytokinin dehydrogenase n=1 Tax=Dioscorea zingiberensis TaxID=325984 RepID=A0A9D5DA20_9LILI|nr:hypothetical protein J5N97_006374 [Dioscorea zingiberensis]